VIFTHDPRQISGFLEEKRRNAVNVA